MGGSADLKQLARKESTFSFFQKSEFIPQICNAAFFFPIGITQQKTEQ
ncbi:hypothetical protein FDUTEX481_04929 [Tolypothrix sp. PCC 7601]|nr:hypothetical protein FDUTEX481_04929 [Tolypothrix sp. PCC 7601]